MLPLDYRATRLFSKPHLTRGIHSAPPDLLVGSGGNAFQFLLFVCIQASMRYWKNILTVLESRGNFCQFNCGQLEYSVVSE